MKKPSRPAAHDNPASLGVDLELLPSTPGLTTGQELLDDPLGFLQ